MTWFSSLQYVLPGVPMTVALALVALLGYWAGRRSRVQVDEAARARRRELRRAKAVVRQLESVSQQVRLSLANHHSAISNFKQSVEAISRGERLDNLQALSDEAERMLRPTMKLATQIAHAYDEIRQQTNQLMTFTEIRTDPLTGISNRRALDETLAALLGMYSRYGLVFSLAIIDVDHFKRVNDKHGHVHGDRALAQLADLLETHARDTDLVTRYGGEEFVVAMPGTDLSGAGVFGQRIRHAVSRKLKLTVSIGVASIREGDSAETLLNRADAALYSAKHSGRNCVFHHTGEAMQRVVAEPLPSHASMRHSQMRDSSAAAEARSDDEASTPAATTEPVDSQPLEEDQLVTL